MKKIILTSLATIMVSFFQVCLGQETVWETLETRTELKIRKEKNLLVLFVLNAGEKTVQLDNRLGNKIDINDIDADKISSMSILRGSEAISKYGENGKDGVIVIDLKDFTSLSNTPKKLFDVGEKKD